MYLSNDLDSSIGLKSDCQPNFSTGPGGGRPPSAAAASAPVQTRFRPEFSISKPGVSRARTASESRVSFRFFPDDDGDDGGGGYSTTVTSLMTVHVVLVAIVGATANLCVFLALSVGQKVSGNLLLLNLCVADSMVCIISGPLTVMSWEWPALSSYTIVNAAQVSGVGQRRQKSEDRNGFGRAFRENPDTTGGNVCNSTRVS